MIQNLTIRRFKSIKELTLPCRKVNLFIGASGSGKTNILEALHLLCRLGWGLPLDGSLRLSAELGFDTLFYRQFFDEPIEITADDLCVRATRREPDSLLIESMPSGGAYPVQFGGTASVADLRRIRYYSYASSEVWSYQTDPEAAHHIVLPPHGSNLFYVARHHEKVFELMKVLAGPPVMKLHFDSSAKKFRISEVRGDDILEYSLECLSERERRYFFHAAILRTSKEATLVFDGMESYLTGELIAEDHSNQFFISCHHLFPLTAIWAIVEKVHPEDLACFVCDRSWERGTWVREVSASELQQLISPGDHGILPSGS